MLVSARRIAPKRAVPVQFQALSCATRKCRKLLRDNGLTRYVQVEGSFDRRAESALGLLANVRRQLLPPTSKQHGRNLHAPLTAHHASRISISAMARGCQASKDAAVERPKNRSLTARISALMRSIRKPARPARRSAARRAGPADWALEQQAAPRELAGLGRDEGARHVQRLRKRTDADAVLALQMRHRDQQAVLRPADAHAAAEMLAHHLHARRDGQKIVDQRAEALVRSAVEQRRARHRRRQRDSGACVQRRDSRLAGARCAAA